MALVSSWRLWAKSSHNGSLQLCWSRCTHSHLGIPLSHQMSSLLCTWTAALSEYRRLHPPDGIFSLVCLWNRQLPRSQHIQHHGPLYPLFALRTSQVVLSCSSYPPLWTCTCHTQTRLPTWTWLSAPPFPWLAWTTVSYSTAQTMLWPKQASDICYLQLLDNLRILVHSQSLSIPNDSAGPRNSRTSAFPRIVSQASIQCIQCQANRNSSLLLRLTASQLSIGSLGTRTLIAWDVHFQPIPQKRWNRILEPGQRGVALVQLRVVPRNKHDVYAFIRKGHANQAWQLSNIAMAFRQSSRTLRRRCNDPESRMTTSTA